MSAGINAVGYGALSVTDTGGVTLPECTTEGVPSRAKGMVLSVEKNGVRVKWGGGTSDTGVGNGTLLNVGDVVVLDSWSNPRNNWRSVMLGANFASDVTGTTGELSVDFFD